jgi:Protein of unknown function (DUF664)
MTFRDRSKSGPCSTNRRKFLITSAAFSTATAGTKLSWGSGSKDESDDGWVVGPKDGYSPQIGTLVSMMTVMRSQVLSSTKGLTQADLDFLLDSKANTIGALLMHLAATDAYYHLKTFDGKPWGSWDSSIKQQWDIPMNLGEPARKTIKGHSLDYYLDALKQTREKTFNEFRKRDDKWLLSLDKANPEWGRVNYFAEWFHVCEHESNHNGQIKFIKARLPGAKPDTGSG